MQIDSLKYFHDVAILKSISKVANNSHISQPALSQQLSKLEESLGVTLLERSNKGVVLTEEGEILLKYSKEILKTYEHLLSEISDHKKNKNKVRVETDGGAGSYLLAGVMPKLLVEFNDFKVSIRNEEYINSYSNLLHDVCDIVITQKRINDVNLNSQYIGRDDYVLVCGTNGDEKRNIDSYFILYDDEDLKKYISSLKIRLTMSFKSNSIETIKLYLMNSSCIALLPRLSVIKEIEEGKLKVMKNDVFEYSYELFINHKANIQKEVKEKIDIISKELQKEMNLI